MPVPSNRSVVIISTLLTLLMAGGATLGVGVQRGWLRTGSVASSQEAVVHTGTVAAENGITPAAAPGPAPVAPAATDASGEIGAYQQKLDEAYRALDEAYAQIRVLQAPASRPASINDGGARHGDHDRGDDRGERRDHRHGDD